MTVGRKVDNKGRSTSSFKQNRRMKIDGSFVAMTEEMLASPALGALTLAERRMLDRLCLEHLRHAGTENGNLVCTYDDFVQFGVRRNSIASGLRVLRALGFIEIIEKGRRSWGGHHHPSRYRLTFVLGKIAPTDEWKRIASLERAERVARSVRAKKVQARKVTIPSNETGPTGPCKNARSGPIS